MKRTTTIAPLVGLSLVLAACGGDSEVAVDQPSVTTAVLADDDDELRSPTPIEAVASSDAGRNDPTASAEAAPAVAAGDSATTDMMIAPFVAEYELSDELTELPTADIGYVFDRGGEVTAEQVVQIAAAFGLDGEPRRTEDGSWQIGPDDGTAPTVWVYPDTQQSWSYNSAWADALAIEPCAVSVDSEGNETTDCPEPEPPAGVPGAEEAEQRTRDALGALGVDVGPLEFESFADEWSANVTVTETAAEGAAAIRYWNFGYGGEGLLQYAGGSLATPEPVGPYELVDLETVFARLQERAGMGIARPMAEDTAIELLDDAATSRPAPEGGDDVTEPAISDPLPVDDGGDREAVTVTLVDVEADLWWVWDADGALWLVPAYRFVDSDGGWHTVPAVTDEFLIEVEPPLDGPIPVEPDGGIGDGAEPLPAPDESLPPVPTETIVGGETELGILEGFIGLSIEEFTAEAERLGYQVRIVVQDGESLIVTEDFVADRVNVAVEGPRVTGVESIG